MCGFTFLCLSPLQCPFCFLRKEGLSKCGRCKQACYCDVECQVGVFGLAGREGLVSAEDRDPSILLSHPCHGIPGPSRSQSWKAAWWRRVWLDAPVCWHAGLRVMGSNILGPHIGSKVETGKVGETQGPHWIQAGVSPRSTVRPPRLPATDGMCRDNQ